MTLPTKSQAIKIIKILFPHYSHYDFSNLDIHIGEYDRNGERHTESILTIQFPNLAFSDVDMTIRFWKSGIQIWKTDKKKNLSSLEYSVNQFDLYTYLQKEKIV